MASCSFYSIVLITPSDQTHLDVANIKLNEVKRFSMGDDRIDIGSVNGLIETYGFPPVIAALEAQALACQVSDSQIVSKVQGIIEKTYLFPAAIDIDARQSILDSISIIYIQVKAAQEHIATIKAMSNNDLETAFDSAIDLNYSTDDASKLFNDHAKALKKAVVELAKTAKVDDETSIVTAVASLVFDIIQIMALAEGLHHTSYKAKQMIVTSIAMSSIDLWVQNKQLKQALDNVIPGTVAFLMFAGNSILLQPQPTSRQEQPLRQRCKCIVL